MADPIRCVYAMEDGYFCTKHSDGFYDGSCRLLEGKPCEDQKPPKPITNADRIRSMTDEELARWIADELIEPGYYTRDHGYKLWLDWLRQEAET